MIINGLTLLAASPIVDMADGKMVGKGGTSFGLGEAGYDIRIKQEIRFLKRNDAQQSRMVRVLTQTANTLESIPSSGRFTLASAIEQFQMPNWLTGIVHDKSTWARRGLSVFNTVIEPGWHGFLTLELVYHGDEELIIPAGSGIAQVMFHEVTEPRAYTGKYQNQADQPIAAIDSKLEESPEFVKDFNQLSFADQQELLTGKRPDPKY